MWKPMSDIGFYSCDFDDLLFVDVERLQTLVRIYSTHVQHSVLNM
jgi:hypothetical protein